MELEYHNSFSKYIDKIKDKRIKNECLELIEKIGALGSLSELPDVKKLKGFQYSTG